MSIPHYHLVLTACVAPPSERPVVARFRVADRLADYCEALRHWLNFDDPRCGGILLLENSGYPLSVFRELAASENRFGRVIDIRHSGDNKFPEGVSYGYAELGMLDAASKTCALWREAPMLVKVTGRLTFPELPRLIDDVKRSDRLIADARNATLPWLRRSDNGYLTTQLILFTPQFYRDQFYGVRGRMGPAPKVTTMESILYQSAWGIRDQPGVRFRFPVNCAPVGKAAHWAKDYRSSRERAKNTLRAACRIVAPWLWL